MKKRKKKKNIYIYIYIDEWLWEKKSKDILLEKRESLLINAQKINRAYDHTNSLTCMLVVIMA